MEVKSKGRKSSLGSELRPGWGFGFLVFFLWFGGCLFWVWGWVGGGCWVGFWFLFLSRKNCDLTRMIKGPIGRGAKKWGGEGLRGL